MTLHDRVKFFDQINALHGRTVDVIRESIRAGALDIKYEVTEYLNVYSAAVRDSLEEEEEEDTDN
jgi:hypothetical protein